jgi:uncharacterized protein YbbC (DUF1343 family)
MFLNGEGLLSGTGCLRTSCGEDERMVKVDAFQETGLPWVPSSPQVPHGDTPLYYPATGIAGELYAVSIGVGYTIPFQTFAAQWINADSLATGLNALKLPGVIFRPIHYKPYFSTLQGKWFTGCRFISRTPPLPQLTLLQFYIMQEAHRLWPEEEPLSQCVILPGTRCSTRFAELMRCD